MRKIGSFDKKQNARQFGRALGHYAIEYKIIREENRYELWVYREEQIKQAQQLYQEFSENPQSIAFTQPPTHARQHRRKTNYRWFRRQQRHRLAIITYGLAAISLIIFLLLVSPQKYTLFASLSFSSPQLAGQLPWSQPWRFITPAFLHFGMIHILFNLWWLISLGKLIEAQESRIFFLCFVIIAMIGSNTLQWWLGGSYFGGLSGVVYALLGYLWLSAKFNPWSGYYVGNDVIIWMMGWLVICFTGILGPVANWAHLGGLVLGAVFAGIRSLLRRR